VKPASLLDAESQHDGRTFWWKRLFPVNREIAAKTILVVWGNYFLFAMIAATLIKDGNLQTVLVQNGLIVTCCLIFNWLLYRLLSAFQAGDIAMPLFLLTIPTMILTIVSVVTDRAVIALAIAVFGFSDWPDANTYWPISRGSILDESFVRYFVFASWGGIYLALAGTVTAQHALVHSRQLEGLNRKSALQALRYQLNPHFVFNALNSVSSLIIDRKNIAAEKLVDDLADYMRCVLDDDGESMVTVEQEVTQQIRYLEIEKIRFPERLIFEADVQPSVKKWKIPALIIQPLVENAIKYGVANTLDSVRIRISAREEAGRLRIDVANDGRIIPTSDKNGRTGKGLLNIQQRLLALYGHNAAIWIANDRDSMTHATIILPDELQAFADS